MADWLLQEVCPRLLENIGYDDLVDQKGEALCVDSSLCRKLPRVEKEVGDYTNPHNTRWNRQPCCVVKNEK